MDTSAINSIASLILNTIRVNVKGAKNSSGPRPGLSFWFDNLNRSEGPVFSIRPTGLKRHVISVEFGAYSAPCIKHIQNEAPEEAYLLAYSFIEQLKEKYDVLLNEKPIESDWKVITDFKLEVTRKLSDLKGGDDISDSVKLVMLPLISAFTELIGYEENLDTVIESEGTEEGTIIQVLMNKRERNPRNRLLCLSIHGEYCGVCGFKPEDKYGTEFGTILEVHHIEPLSEIDTPKTYNPKSDLVPLCPNCHRAIHSKKPAYTPAELKELLLQ